MHGRSRVALGLALIGAGVVGLLPACTTAQADPVEVTYYYLPG